MRIIVLKFGGTSVGSVERILKVAEKIVSTKRKGDDAAVVVSAMGKTTDELVELAEKISEDVLSIITTVPGLPNVSINQSIPIDHETTKWIYRTYFLDLNDLEAQNYAFLDQVREEDFVICETVQKGLQSKGYTLGRFSLTENCVHHFHLLVQHALESEEAYVPLIVEVK